MASKRALRRYACEGKQRFTTYYQAAYVATQMRRRRQEVVNQYKCQFCSGWHVGHTTIRRRRALVA